MFDAILKEVAASVKESVMSGLKALSDKLEPRIKSLEDRFDNQPQPRDGKDGADGKSVTIEEIKPELQKMVEAIQIPISEKGEKGDRGEQGEKGDSITLDDVKPFLTEAVQEAAQQLKAPEVDYETVKSFIREEVQTIPVPKDGTSVTLDDVMPIIKEAVTDATQHIFIDYDLVKNFITDEVSAIPKSEDGKSVTAEDVRPILKEMVDALEIPAGEKGDPGRDVTIDDVRPLIEETIKEAVSQIPVPRDGAPGKDAEPVDMAILQQMVDKTANEKIHAMQSVLSAQIKSLVDEVVEVTVSKIPVPKDGKDADPIDMNALQKMTDAAVEKAVAAISIPEPKHGRDGRDALDLEILPDIDPEKSYQRNTYALHQGGLWRSFERTKGMRGWEIVVDGIADIQIDYDGERSVKITTEKSSGEIISKEFAMPLVIDRGVFKDGSTYSVNDGVTFGGSYWIAQKDNPQGKPGDGNQDFRLAVKRGRDANAKVKAGS